MARPERSHLEAHYADLSSKGFFAGLIDYMVSRRSYDSTACSTAARRFCICVPIWKYASHKSYH